MIEVYAEKDLSPEQVFFILLLPLSQRLLKKKNLSKSVEEIKKQLKKILGVTQKEQNSQWLSYRCLVLKVIYINIDLQTFLRLSNKTKIVRVF